MVSKQIKISIATFVAGIILGVGTTVYGAVVTSPYGYYGPFLGYSYKNQATTWDGSSGGIRGEATVSVDGSGTAPAGYMGAQARLFKDDVLYLYNSMWYNSSPTTRMADQTDSAFPSGTYYSKGITAAYNGNGYSQYYTFQSPSLNH